MEEYNLNQFNKYKNQNDTDAKLEKMRQMALDETKVKDIAQKLFLSDSAVRNHITRIFKKLEVENTSELCKKSKKKI